MKKTEQVKEDLQDTTERVYDTYREGTSDGINIQPNNEVIDTPRTGYEGVFKE